MHEAAYIERFDQSLLTLGTAFLNAHDAEGTDKNAINTQTESDHTDIDNQDSYDLGPDNNSKILRTLSNIEDLINSNDYTGAAEEILKINIGSLPLSALERYTDALEQTAHGLYNKDTYLNAQLASQNLVVIAVSDAVEEMKGPLNLFGKDESATIASLDLFDGGGSSLPTLIWTDIDEGIGMADEYNIQLSPNTGALSRHMTNETTGNHRAASLDHGGAAGQHVYSLDLKMGF